MELSNNFKEWKAYAKGKPVITIRLSDELIFNNSFKYKSHRDFIASILEGQKLRVTRWAHEYGTFGDVKKWGLVYARTDSEINPEVEIHGIMGENIERIEE